MKLGKDGKYHYNLYYIYAEDKENNRLSRQKIALLWAKTQEIIGEKQKN